MTATSSAPGKLMLFGEHAVIYGYPSVVTAIDSRLSATVERNGTEDIFVTPQVGDTRFVRRALQQFRETYKINDPVRIETHSEFSHTFGFGSSSAVTVAVLKSLCVAFSIPHGERNLFDMAFHTVLAVQGSGSGFDVAAAVYGGTLYYVTGGKRIDTLSIPSLPLLIAYSGVKADTATYVAKVNSLYKTHPDTTKSIFAAIQDVTDKGRQFLEKGDMPEAGRCMSQNHELLIQLGVSTPLLDSLVDAACREGAYGAKLSGAGGGDCMIALVPDAKRESIVSALTALGGQIMTVGSQAAGVKSL